jgi:hypothetical protein
MNLEVNGLDTWLSSGASETAPFSSYLIRVVMAKPY